MKNKRNLLIKIFTIIMVVALGISCFGCEKVRPDNNKEEFKFRNPENSITKYHLYIDLNHDAKFAVPVFTNVAYSGGFSSDYSYAKFISAEGENINDVKLTGNIESGGVYGGADSLLIYTFSMTATAIKNLWNKDVTVRKITSMRFSIYDNETSVPVDISFDMSNRDILCDYHELCEGELPQYKTYSDTDYNGKNFWPYYTQMFWNYAAWGGVNRYDYDHKAILKAVYFEHNVFQVKDLVLTYYTWSSGQGIKFQIENPLDMNYSLALMTDMFEFNVQITEENNDYSFLGDNLVFEVEYNGSVHKVIVKNIQLHGRRKALNDVKQANVSM